MTKPTRGANLPVLFGGESGPALRRVAEYGNGWFGFNLTPDEAAAKIGKVEELLKANRRKLTEVEIIISPYTKPMTADDLKRYRDAGVQEVVIMTGRPPRTIEEAKTRLEEAARTWVAPASKL